MSYITVKKFKDGYKLTGGMHLEQDKATRKIYPLPIVNRDNDGKLIGMGNDDDNLKLIKISDETASQIKATIHKKDELKKQLFDIIDKMVKGVKTVPLTGMNHMLIERINRIIRHELMEDVKDVKPEEVKDVKEIKKDIKTEIKALMKEIKDSEKKYKIDVNKNLNEINKLNEMIKEHDTKLKQKSVLRSINLLMKEIKDNEDKYKIDVNKNLNEVEKLNKLIAIVENKIKMDKHIIKNEVLKNDVNHSERISKNKVKSDVNELDEQNELIYMYNYFRNINKKENSKGEDDYNLLADITSELTDHINNYYDDKYNEEIHNEDYDKKLLKHYNVDWDLLSKVIKSQKEKSKNVINYVKNKGQIIEDKSAPKLLQQFEGDLDSAFKYRADAIKSDEKENLEKMLDALKNNFPPEYLQKIREDHDRKKREDVKDEPAEKPDKENKTNAARRKKQTKVKDPVKKKKERKNREDAKDEPAENKPTKEDLKKLTKQQLLTFDNTLKMYMKKDDMINRILNKK
jgi:hypothetical protein